MKALHPQIAGAAADLPECDAVRTSSKEETLHGRYCKMTSCLPCASGSDLSSSSSCDVLVVGLEGSGKSLLCRRLQSEHIVPFSVQYSASESDSVCCGKMSHKTWSDSACMHVCQMMGALHVLGLMPMKKYSHPCVNPLIPTQASMRARRPPTLSPSAPTPLPPTGYS